MKKVYTAGNVPEAQIVSDLLEAHRIHHIIKNRDLQSTLGELPVPETFPTIWVNEGEFIQAKKLIDELNEKKVKGSVWICQCGESLEPQFSSCWKCGRERQKS